MRVRYLGEAREIPHTWNPVGAETTNPSGLHIRALKLLQRMHPTVTILEEVAIEPIPHKTLYLDFFIPVLYYAIEVHGEQHYKFVPHYHETRQNFIFAHKNDEMKKDWCILNDLVFIELPFDKEDEWESIINGQ